MKNKGAIVWNETAWWILALLVIGVVVLAFFFMRKYGINLLDEIFRKIRIR